MQLTDRSIQTVPYPPWLEAVGPVEGEPVMLIHGSTLTRKLWLPQVKALQSIYRVYLPDLPGHGTQSGNLFHFDRAVDLLGQTLALTGHPRAVVAGISLGGHVATLFASQHPDCVRGLVISGASMNFTGLTGRWVRLVARFMLLKPFQSKLVRQAEKNIRKKWPREIAEALIAAGIYPAGAARSFLEIGQYDFREALRSVRAPVLILNGETDRPNRKQEASFSAVARQARVETVPGAGHACNLENITDYNRRLLAFLSEIYR